MAEFCLECLEKLDQKNYPKWAVRLSWTKCLCEGCGKQKRVVLGVLERPALVVKMVVTAAMDGLGMRRAIRTAPHTGSVDSSL